MTDTEKWYFTADANANGFTYIHVYQTTWDPVRKTTKRSAKRYVGRLFDDGHVAPCKSFLESFPQYAGKTLFFTQDKQLVDEATYWQLIEPVATKATQEVCDPYAHWTPRKEKANSVQVGFTWALETFAHQSGIYQTLIETFGKRIAGLLLSLAIKEADMTAQHEPFEVWFSNVYLKHGLSLNEVDIEELLTENITFDQIESYFNRRITAKRATHANVLAFDIETPTYANQLDCGLGLDRWSTTVLMDARDGEVLGGSFVRGALPDDVLYDEIFYQADRFGLDEDNLIVVTNRSVERLEAEDIRYIQGNLPLDNHLKSLFEAHDQDLSAPENGDLPLHRFGFTLLDDTETYWHLYRNVRQHEATIATLNGNVEVAIEARDNQNLSPAMAHYYNRFMQSIKGFEVNFGALPNRLALDDKAKFAGHFALRSVGSHNAFDTLKTYQLRRSVKESLSHSMPWITSNDTLFDDLTFGYQFVGLLAMSLRTMLQMTVSRESEGDLVPIEPLLAKLRQLHATKHESTNTWMVDNVPTSVRVTLKRFGLPTVAKILN